jgi:hypothetical protein
MREWALAWHASYVAANPTSSWGREPTDAVLEAIYACGLGDASDADRRSRLAVLPRGASLIDHVDRIIATRDGPPKPAPTDEEAIALVRRAIAALTKAGCFGYAPAAIRVARSAPDRHPQGQSRRLLDPEDGLRPVMRGAASEDTREVIDYLTESLHNLMASYTLAEWALWPLVENVLGPCPLDAVVELWERGAAIDHDDDGLVVRLPAS